MDALAPGLLAIVGLILVKEAGLPVPIPGDLIVIGAGVAAGRGDLDPGAAIFAIIAASIVGGVVQYGLLRAVARPVLERGLRRVTTEGALDRQTERFRRGGARSVAIARSTPGVRIVAIAASALAAIPAAAFVIGLSIGNALFIGAHFALGYVVGEPIVRSLGGALGPIAIIAVVLGIVGGLGWIALRRRGGAAFPPRAVIGDWADACCPACLSIGFVEARRDIGAAS
ncbi:MAG: VTT domain-containing protein [Chloroflexota bacterium]|nr:VTT domain-containing protein [Chloroflexota bacterium]